MCVCVDGIFRGTCFTHLDGEKYFYLSIVSKNKWIMKTFRTSHYVSLLILVNAKLSVTSVFWIFERLVSLLTLTYAFMCVHNNRLHNTQQEKLISGHMLHTQTKIV